jgi:hypothetical protein
MADHDRGWAAGQAGLREFVLAGETSPESTPLVASDDRGQQEHPHLTATGAQMSQISWRTTAAHQPTEDEKERTL